MPVRAFERYIPLMGEYKIRYAEAVVNCQNSDKEKNFLCVCLLHHWLNKAKEALGYMFVCVWQPDLSSPSKC